jgi:hypothetical protein
MASGWFIIAPYGESTGSGLSGTIPKGAKAYDASGATYTALNNDFLNDNATPVIIGGSKWEPVMGPFPTQAAAVQATPPSWQSVLAGSVEGAVTGSTPLPQPSPAAELTSWETAIGKFVEALDSKNLWVRVTKVAVGSIMIIAGLAKITGTDKAITDVAKGAIP